MLVGAAELILDEIFRIGELAHIVIQGRHLAEQAVGADSLGPGLHHIGHHQGVMVGAGNGDHQFLHQGLFQAHQLHKAEARAVAEGQLQHRAHGEKQNQGKQAVDSHGGQLHGDFRRGRLGQQRRAEPDQNLAHGQGNHAPDHILAALRAGHQPGRQHAAQKIVNEERIVRLKHEHAEERKQQAHGTVAPGRGHHGYQTHGPGHGKSCGKGIEQTYAVHAQTQQIDALGAHAEQEEQKGDEQHVLAAQRRAGLAAGGHKKAHRKQ